MENPKVSASDVLQDKIVLGSAAVVTGLLAMIGWIVFGQGKPEEDAKKKTAYAFLHCPACKEELPYSLASDGKKCSSCGKGSYIPTVDSIKKGGEVARTGWGRILLFGVIVLVAVEAWALVYVHRSRVLRRILDEQLNRLLVTACPFCGRKIGYPISKVGVGTVCVQCKTAFLLPASAVDP